MSTGTTSYADVVAGVRAALVGRYRDQLHYDEDSGAWRFHHRTARFVTETT